jgi:hypothetical protein
MEHRLTITLPDETFQSLAEAAMKLGQTPEEVAVEWIAESAPAKAANGEHKKKGDITRLFGSWDSGDPNSADNERIDADLAREYGRGLDGDEE